VRSITKVVQLTSRQTHGPALGITGRDDRSRSAEPRRTLSYSAAQISMRILELENRCSGNRTVGSNPTLSVNYSNNDCQLSASEAANVASDQ
jgi:hypothetical protein